MKGIADTGFLIALANARDLHHSWALRVAEQVTEPLLTCEPVLAEAAFHLRNSALVLEMIAEGLVTLAFDCNDHLQQLAKLAARYADRQPDLADLCLIRMSELYPATQYCDGRSGFLAVSPEQTRSYSNHHAAGAVKRQKNQPQIAQICAEHRGCASGLFGCSGLLSKPANRSPFFRAGRDRSW